MLRSPYQLLFGRRETRRYKYPKGRAHKIHRDFVDRAAQSKGMTQSKYVVETMLRQASRDLKEPIPELPAELVEVAAATHGMSKREFEKWAAEQWAVKEQASGRHIVPVAGFEKAVVRRSRAGARSK